MRWMRSGPTVTATQRLANHMQIRGNPTPLQALMVSSRSCPTYLIKNTNYSASFKVIGMVGRSPLPTASLLIELITVSKGVMIASTRESRIVTALSIFQVPSSPH